MMEQYFEKYRTGLDALEKNPQTTEEQFLYRLSVRSKVRRTVRILVSVAAVLAAAVVSSVLFLDSRLDSMPDPVRICLDEYNEGIRPLYEDIVRMETESELCREMEISNTIEELVATSEAFSLQLSGMDNARRTDMMRIYCRRQTECIAGLYRSCLYAYEGTGVSESVK